jgi:UDP-N-acetyl-D-glucosamine dehydrogenase
MGTNVTGFCTKIKERTAKVGVIGLGYVGLPLALLSAGEGFDTTGFDIDPGKMEKIRKGESYINHIPAASIRKAIEKQHFQATDDFTRLKEMDAIIICVPTPLGKHGEPDLSFVRSGRCALAAWPIDCAREYNLPGNHRRRSAAGIGARRAAVSRLTVYHRRRHGDGVRWR